MRTAFWLFGGMSAGLGILLAALGGFGVPGGDVAVQVSRLGFDGLPELTIYPTGWLALFLLGTGVALMVKANASAWKHTGGY